MSHKISLDKEYRLTIPIKLIRNINPKPDEYLKIILRKDRKVDYLYLREPSKPPSRKEVQVRRKLPERLIETLKLVPCDILVIEGIIKLETKKTNTPFIDDKFDLLSLPLDGLMIDTFIRDNEEWCKFWSSSKYGGIINEIELKRFIPINRETGESFGLMQAESRKYGEKFDFTNTLINEHEKFLEISETLGINRDAWKFGLIYNHSLSIELIEKYKNSFSRELKVANSYITKSATITKMAYQIYISSKILNYIFNLVLKELRCSVVKELYLKDNENFRKFLKGFIIKDLLGDGTVLTNKDRTHLDIILSEKDVNVQKDIIAILNFFGINSIAHKNKIDISTDFDSCIWFLKNGIFSSHYFNRQKLLSYILNNHYFKTLYLRLKTVLRNISITEFKNKNKLNHRTATMYLLRNMKRGYLSRTGNRKYPLYSVSTKGKEFIKLIKSLETEVQTE